MEVETYEAIERETAEHAPEMEAEAVELIETLGLEGQKKLLRPDEETGQRRNPYRRMTEQENRVYGALLDTKCKPEDFDMEVMPLRVLQVLHHSREVFDKVKVWYTDDAAVDDPILVGYLDRKEHGLGGYGDAMFLLCRWGKELLPFRDLKEQAAEKLMEEWRRDAEKAKHTADVFLAALESNVRAHLNGENVTKHLTSLG